MMKSNKIVCVIPARLESSRFPQKILYPLLGKPLLQWVWEAAQQVECFDEIVFAIDHHLTAAVIEKFQGRYIMTSPKHESGTMRIIELYREKKLEGDIWVNWQADAPFFTPQVFDDLLQSIKDPNASIWTLVKKFNESSRIELSSEVKVVVNQLGDALYFSRAKIPFMREGVDTNIYFNHLGLYAYRASALDQIAEMGKSQLEEAEKLEQLKWLDYGLKIRVHLTECFSPEINTKEDVLHALAFLGA